MPSRAIPGYNELPSSRSSHRPGKRDPGQSPGPCWVFPPKWLPCGPAGVPLPVSGCRAPGPSCRPPLPAPFTTRGLRIKPSPYGRPWTPAAGLSASTGPPCPVTALCRLPVTSSRKAGFLEGHPGRGTSGQNPKLLRLVVGCSRPALNPSKAPEWPPSYGPSGCNHSCVETGSTDKTRAGTDWKLSAALGPGTRCSEQSAEQAWLHGAGRESICLFFFPSQTEAVFFPRAWPPHGLMEGLLLPPITLRKEKGHKTQQDVVAIPRTAPWGLFLHSQIPSVFMATQR